MTAPRPARARRGAGLSDLVVAMAIVLVFGLLVLAVIPRDRERQRSATCELNLRQIGVTLSLYDQATGSLPTATAGGDEGPGVLGSLIGGLGRIDVDGLAEPRPAAEFAYDPDLVRPRPVLGFTCPSDRGPATDSWPAPVSYRAITGIATDGEDGAFALGVPHTMAEVEAGAGAAYSAAFLERLIGRGRSSADNRAAYRLVPGPVTTGCPPAGAADRRDEAGSNWGDPGWANTLANLALRPGEGPSCVATDGRSARIGASSNHLDGAHVLLFDTSVRSVRPGVAPAIWRALGRPFTAGGHGGAPASR